MQNSRIIEISGPIASGKSTMALALHNTLTKKGIKSKIICLGSMGGLTYFFSILVLLLRMRSKKIFKLLKVDRNTHPLTLIDLQFIQKISTVITFLEILSINLLLLIKIIFPLKFRKIDKLIIDEGFINILGGYLQIKIKFKALKRIAFKMLITLFIYINSKYDVKYVYIDNAELARRWRMRKSFYFLSILGESHYLDFTNYIRISRLFLLHRLLKSRHQSKIFGRSVATFYTVIGR